MLYLPFWILKWNSYQQIKDIWIIVSRSFWVKFIMEDNIMVVSTIKNNNKNVVPYLLIFFSCWLVFFMFIFEANRLVFIVRSHTQEHQWHYHVVTPFVEYVTMRLLRLKTSNVPSVIRDFRWTLILFQLIRGNVKHLSQNQWPTSSTKLEILYFHKSVIFHLFFQQI